jgi:uncharacterized protein with HEPN domain
VKRPHFIRLRDMLETIDSVAEMMADVDLEGYRRDYMLRRAIERCVEIVSEASRSIPDELKSKFPDQPWPEIAAIGNLLRHKYERIDDLIMWKIPTQSFPSLRATVALMMADDEL